MGTLLIILSLISIGLAIYGKYQDTTPLWTRYYDFSNDTVLGIFSFSIGCVFHTPFMLAFQELYSAEYERLIFPFIFIMILYLFIQSTIILDYDNNLDFLFTILMILSWIIEFMFFMTSTSIIFNPDNNATQILNPEITTYRDAHFTLKQSISNVVIAIVITIILVFMFYVIIQIGKQAKNELKSFLEKKENGKIKKEAEISYQFDISKNNQSDFKEEVNYIEEILRYWRNNTLDIKICDRTKWRILTESLKILQDCSTSHAKQDIEYLNKNILPDVYVMIVNNECPDEMIDALLEACTNIINQEKETDNMRVDATVQGLKAAMATKGLIKNSK